MLAIKEIQRKDVKEITVVPWLTNPKPSPSVSSTPKPKTSFQAIILSSNASPSTTISPSTTVSPSVTASQSISITPSKSYSTSPTPSNSQKPQLINLSIFEQIQSNNEIENSPNEEQPSENTKQETIIMEEFKDDLEEVILVNATKFHNLLSQVATANENAVIVAVVSRSTTVGGFNFAELWLDQWVCSLKRVGLENNFLLIAIDRPAYRFAQIRGYPVIHSAQVPTSIKVIEDKPVGTWIDILRIKPIFALSVLEFGFNLLWSDLDVIFFSDPFPLFALEQQADAFFSYEEPTNTGFYYVRSTNASIASFIKWNQMCMLYNDGTTHDQNIFNSLLEIFPWKMFILSVNWFVSVCSLPNKTFVIPEDSLYILHVNCYWGAELKVERTKFYGLWLVRESIENELGHSDGVCIEDPKWPKANLTQIELFDYATQRNPVRFLGFNQVTEATQPDPVIDIFASSKKQRV